MQKVLNSARDSHLGSEAHHNGNALINEGNLKTKKARENKEAELRKHIVTLNSLKRRMATKIVAGTLKVEDQVPLDI